MTDLATRGEMPLDQPKTLATVEASPMEILRDMVARGASPDAIEKISALAERWDDRAREATYMKAMNACQSELPAVSKDTFRSDTNSWYAKLEKIAKTIAATAHKHGFSLSYGTADCPRGGQWLRFTLDVMHIGGHSRQYLFDVPVDNVGPNGKANKSESHGTISSNTIAKKMLLCNAFNVTLQGMEDATGAPRPQTPEQEEEERKGYATIRELLETREVNMERFWAAMGCTRVEDIPVANYKEVIRNLTTKPVKK